MTHSPESLERYSARSEWPTLKAPELFFSPSISHSIFLGLTATDRILYTSCAHLPSTSQQHWLKLQLGDLLYAGIRQGLMGRQARHEFCMYMIDWKMSQAYRELRLSSTTSDSHSLNPIRNFSMDDHWACSFSHCPTRGHRSLWALGEMQVPTCPDLNSISLLSELLTALLRALLDSGATRSSFEAITFR